MAYRESFGFSFRLTPWVKRLLIANVAVFIVTPLLIQPLFGYLAFDPALTLFRPWTPLTYMFVHAGFWHLLINMLGLFFFGPALESHWGSREFLKYYLCCGLGGAAFCFIFAWNAPVVGASAAIFGVMLAFALNWPDVPIYIWGIFPVKAKWLVGFMVVVTLFSVIQGSGGGTSHFAHLGGLAAGLVYIKMDFRTSRWFKRLKKRLPRSRFTVVPSPRPPAAKAQQTRRREQERLLDEVDRVLDKISTQGLASLSAEERRVLDEASRRNQSD